MSIVSTQNPLTQINFRIPFDLVRPDLVEPAVDDLLASARAEVERIAGQPLPRTYENTMRALDVLTERLDFALSVVRHLESVVTTPELRAAYNAVQPKVSAFYAGLPLHEGLWNAVQTYAATPEAQHLKGAQQRYLEKTIDAFRRHGAELDAPGKQRLQEIDVELARITTKYGENVVDATKAFELVITDEAKLAGLPVSAREAARANAQAKGEEGWRFTLQAPSYTAVLTYLDDAAFRQQMYHANATKAAEAPFDNRDLIAQVLRLRREKARLLGYRDFADFILADRMAHSGERAARFLDELRHKTEARFHHENEDLAAFRRTLEGESAPPLQPWDVAYYAEKQRQALYDFDEEELRPYFAAERVLQGMFRLVQMLFGITVREQTEVPVWHPETKYYTIEDSDGTLLGGFYADWFPRETKRGGAWMDAFITGGPAAQGFAPHLGLMCGNMTPPIGDKPALLTHREVETVFHEFGHLLHHSLSTVEVRSLAGTSVPWDFVELPSQIMENWTWEKEVLAMLARHNETGEPIPDELFAKLKRARNFRSANAQMRQLGFGTVDLLLHREYDPERDGDVIEYSRRVLQRFSAVPLPPYQAMIASFTHLFGNPVGYAAAYYSYKWAEVLDADAFTRFQREGIFNQDTGLSFRRGILSRGDSEDPAELYRQFMGRDPDPDALLIRSGLLA